MKKGTKAIKKQLAGFFEGQAKAVAAQIASQVNKLAKKDEEAEEADALREAYKARVQKILDDLDFTEWVDLEDGLQSALVAVARDGVEESLGQLGVKLNADELDQANQDAIDFARDRSASMVGMKWVDDELVPNPDAEWQITDSTREFLRADVTQAMEEGWSNDRLASAIQDNYAFSDARAENIARTETARADIQGNLAGYRASGLVAGKQWLVGDGCCDECQALDGEVVGLDEDFPDDGGDGPPLHPQCRCTVLPVLNDEMETDE